MAASGLGYAVADDALAAQRAAVAAAPTDPVELVRLAEANFGKLPAGAPPAVPPSTYVGGEYREAADEELSHFALSFKSAGWKDPALVAVSQMCVLAWEVATKLVEAIAMGYPVLRDAYRGVASRIHETAEADCTVSVEAVLGREKDPFTVNDFLQAHINKLRHDRFASAVQEAFTKCKSSHDSWQAAKEEVAASMRSWYRNTHGVNSSANAEDMSAILEA